MLMRYDPFREVDQLLRQSWGGGRFAHLPIDAYRRGDEFIAEFDLPGVDRDSIDVTVERDVLQVTAQRAGRYGDEDDVLIAERPQGTVTRQLFLGQGLDTEHITASYDEGVLTVVMPVAEQAKPHKIQIGSGDGGRQAVEAGATS
ncbi:MAG TPA: Hsp20/alpha crystallin family protein [Egibacteraceae bacterium]|nr:Hsp20/alpha crystallin family protein [Egibacteraceae bacterium]